MTAYQRQDSWYRKAKEEGFRSRAAYKLIELNQRFHLFRRGSKVLDLGCAPGGWMQIAAREVGPQGRVIGIDLEAVPPLGQAQALALVGDIRHLETLERLRQALGGLADVVLSDMAPDTSGVGFADHARSVELVRAAAAVAQALLRSGGWMVAKVFDGSDLPELIRELGQGFSPIKRFHPEASRKGSRELYLITSKLDRPKVKTDARKP